MSAPRLLLTRPREDSLALAEVLARHGVDALIEPMMTIRIDEGARLDLSGAQAILLTSANGARALAAACPTGPRGSFPCSPSAAPRPVPRATRASVP